MKKDNEVSLQPGARVLAAVFAMLATLLAGQTLADPYEDIDIAGAVIPPPKCHATLRTFGSKPTESVNETVTIRNGGAQVFWAKSPGLNCANDGNAGIDCGKYTVTIPNPDIAQEDNSVATIMSLALAEGDPPVEFRLTGTDALNTSKTCEQSYQFHMVSAADVGGWGDPHLTTWDGTHYDFQSAGEFTALRGRGLELQTRQAAVPTATVPITNEYTGITHCVALFSAVAARVGTSRITVQPKFGDHDPRSMQLRVNGSPVDLTTAGIVLGSSDDRSPTARRFDGQIRPAEGGAIEIVAADGTQIVVTPAHWDAHNVWYLNIKVHQAAASTGTMGRIVAGDWLPRLPDGTGLGARPDSIDERYQQLYETFADAWRVTDTTSLFDYEASTSTATFTLDEWPRNNPQTCGIPGQMSAQPTTQQAAEQACATVTNPTERADCVFDVAITGNLGFGRSYEVMQAFEPAGPGWQTHAEPASDGGTTTPTGPLGIPWWVWILILILILIFIAWIVRRNQGP